MRDGNSFPFVVWLLLVILACIKYSAILSRATKGKQQSPTERK